MPLKKEMKDSLTRQGMQNTRGVHRNVMAEREEKEREIVFMREHTNKS